MKLFTHDGVEVKVHYSWIIAFGLLTYGLTFSYFKQALPDITTSYHLGYAVVTTIATFVSVLIHEFAHASVAKRFGIQATSVTLYLFGGVSKFKKQPATYKQESMVFLAGPVISLILGAFFYLAFLKTGGPMEMYLADINFILAAVNVLPIYPLDGGKVLRSAVWETKNDFIYATRFAVESGSYMAIALLVFGAVLVSIKISAGIWFLLLGTFLKLANATEQHSFKNIGSVLDKSIDDIFITNKDIIAVPEDITIEEFIHRYFVVHGHHGYPVVSKNGKVNGMVTYWYLKNNFSEKDYPFILLKNVMCKFEDKPEDALPVINIGSNISQALEKMMINNFDRLYVKNNGDYAGMVTKTSILRASGQDA